MLQIILIIILGLLIIYLCFLHKNIKNLTMDLKEYQSQETNTLLHTNSINKDLQELIKVINDELNEIKQKEIVINHQNNQTKKMITNISHDLKTPLTSALGYIEILKSTELEKEKQQKYLSITEERLQKLSVLIHSFFEFSTILTFQEEFEKEQVNIIPILEQCIVPFYEDFETSGRKIILQKKVSKYVLWTNKTMFTRIVDNLISNSLKHGVGNLTISIRNQDQQLMLSFKNKFVDAHLDIDQLFNEFYTTDISRTKGNTGLGLAIVKEFVTLLGGRVTAKKHHQFLTITMIFPER